MKGIKVLTILTSIVLISIFLFANEKPLRPRGVPENANWNKNFKYWSIHGVYLGETRMWYKNGAIMVTQQKIDNSHMKDIQYFENGNLRLIGQNILLENKYRKGKERLEWQAYGKWKEYNGKGILINEVCYTQIYNDREGEWNSEYCGTEIKYNDDGTVKETIQHKLECKYGCEELECKDCIKK